MRTLTHSILRKRLENTDLDRLDILIDTLCRVYDDAGRSRWVVDCFCRSCSTVKQYSVDNLVAERTKKCRCLTAKKYMDGRSKVLGQRYDSMVQRCRVDNEANAAIRKNYGYRGIRNLFDNREHFITYMLSELPHDTYKGVDIDRINNDGHYAPGNLRLVSRSTNLKNTRRNRLFKIKGETVCMTDLHKTIVKYYPKFSYAKKTLENKIYQGMSLDEIILEGLDYTPRLRE